MSLRPYTSSTSAFSLRLMPLNLAAGATPAFLGCGVDSYRRELHRWWPRARCQREDVHNNVFGLLRLRLLGGSSSRRHWKVIRCGLDVCFITTTCTEPKCVFYYCEIPIFFCGGKTENMSFESYKVDLWKFQKTGQNRSKSTQSVGGQTHHKISSKLRRWVALQTPPSAIQRVHGLAARRKEFRQGAEAR